MYELYVEQFTDEEIAREACEFTIGKESKITLEKLAQCEHSPLRTIMFWVRMYKIPTFVSVHFVRHKIGVEHYVKSNREDRGGDVDVTRLTPVNHAMWLNAQSLINLARKRLCYKSHPTTVDIMHRIRDASPEWLQPFLVPECVYRGGWCNELKPCSEQPWRTYE